MPSLITSEPSTRHEGGNSLSIGAVGVLIAISSGVGKPRMPSLVVSAAPSIPGGKLSKAGAAGVLIAISSGVGKPRMPSLAIISFPIFAPICAGTGSCGPPGPPGGIPGGPALQAAWHQEVRQGAAPWSPPNIFCTIIASSSGVPSGGAPGNAPGVGTISFPTPAAA